MTTISGIAKLEQDRAASRAAYFDEFYKREQQRAAEEKASAPVSLTLGNVPVSLGDAEARDLASHLQSHLELYKADPEGQFLLPNGVTVSGKQAQEALGILILREKV